MKWVLTWATSFVEVVRAALANVVRHSPANTVDVSVAMSDSLITVQVSDDSAADCDATLSAALRRLRRDAKQSGGHLQVTKGARGGTLLRWTALLEDDQHPGPSSR